MTAEESDGLAIRSYLRVVLRWKWLILTVTLAVLAGGVAYTWTRTPLYSASTELLYAKQIDIQNPLGQTYIDRSAQQAEIEVVPVIVASSELRTAAEKLMDRGSSSAGYSVTATLQLALSGGYSNIVTITAVSPSPDVAAAAADASAQAFLDWGRENARQQVSDAVDVVRGRLLAMADSAARRSDEYKSLQSSLRQLELLEASVGGSFTIITPASRPSEPFSPDKRRGIVVALAGGFVLALGLAFVLEQLDTRVHGETQVVEILGLGMLGRIPPLTRTERAKSPLKTMVDPSGPAAEAYRVLRSNLDFAAVGDEVRALLICSTVQGEGKSVVACNLAVSMALAGRRVTLVDADLRVPHVHQYYGVPNARGVSTVVSGRDEVGEAMVRISLTRSPTPIDSITVSAAGAGERLARVRVRGSAHASPDRDTKPVWRWTDGDDAVSLRVVPGGPPPPNPGEMVAAGRFGELIRGLAEDSDLVILDSPALTAVGDATALASWVDALLFVADPTKLRLPQLQRARQQLSQLPCRKLGVVLISASHGHGYYSHSAAD